MFAHYDCIHLSKTRKKSHLNFNGIVCERYFNIIPSFSVIFSFTEIIDHLTSLPKLHSTVQQLNIFVIILICYIFSYIWLNGDTCILCKFNTLFWIVHQSLSRYVHESLTSFKFPGSGGTIKFTCSYLLDFTFVAPCVLLQSHGWAKT